jgi:hypothetical protein
LLGQQVAEAAAKANPKLLKDAMTLATLNITNIHHVLNNQTGYMIPASSLRTLKTAAHVDVRPKHKLALNRITKFMHNFTTSALQEASHRAHMHYGDSRVTDKDLEPRHRKPSADMTSLLEESALASRGNSILHSLRNVPAPGDVLWDTADTITLDLTKRKTDTVDTSKRHADIRTRLEDKAPLCDQVTQQQLHRHDTANIKQTAMELWLRLPTPALRKHGVNDEYKNSRLLLLSDTAGQQERIDDIVAINQSTKNLSRCARVRSSMVTLRR